MGRLPPGGGVVSKGLILLMAIGVFAALLTLIWGLQHPPTQYTIVEVTFMEEEATAAEATAAEATAAEATAAEAAAAEAAAAPTGAPPQQDAAQP